ncbi:MAG: hypothetical protein NVS3B7_07050 [Candidatus Elarobacter sp.]
MPIWLIAAILVAAAIAAAFALRASRERSAIGVPTAADEARLLDEGMIVGDAVPIRDDGPVLASRVDITAPRDVLSRDVLPHDDPSVPYVTVDEVGGVTILPSDVIVPADVEPQPRSPGVRWPRRFESPGRPLDGVTRLSLLHDLGIVRAPWGVPLLTQAYEEEPSAEHRRAALRSLAAYRHPDTQGTFDVALHSDDEEERAIADAAIATLRIRAALPS